MSRSRQVMVILTKYGIGISLVALAISLHWPVQTPDSNGPGLLDVLDRTPDWLFLGASCLLAALTVLLPFIRWHVLLRAQDLPFRLPMVLRLGMIGFFVNLFLPGSLGGDVYKAVYVARDPGRRLLAVGTVVLDRAIGLWALFWLVTLAGAWAWLTDAFSDLSQTGAMTLYEIFLGALAATVVSSILCFLLRFLPDCRPAEMPAGRGRLMKFFIALAALSSAIRRFREQKRALAGALALALLAHLGFVLSFYLGARAFCSENEVPSLGAHFLLLPVGMIVQAGFPTPGGLGGAELVFGFLYEVAGFSFTAGLFASLLRRVIGWFLAILGYFISVSLEPEDAQAVIMPGSAWKG